MDTEEDGGPGHRDDGADSGRQGLTYSERLLALARMTEQDPRYAFDMLDAVVTEGAVRLLDHEQRAVPGGMLPANIPRRIVQYWHSETWPDDVRKAILKVQQHNPEMACAVFHEQQAREFIASHFGNDKRALFDLCFHHSMKSDFFRICYLYVYGGIYVDVDIACSGPLESIVANHDFRSFFFHTEGRPWCIDNDFIVAEPESDLIAAIFRNMERNLLRYRDHGQTGGVWADTGPGLATETIMGLLARYILRGEGASLVNGFMTCRHDLSGISYCHDELNYKTSAEGNWRLAPIPEASPPR